MTPKVVLERRGAFDALNAMGPAAKRAIKLALAGLAENPYPPGEMGAVKRLDAPSSGEPVFRLRVGEYRAVYVVRATEIRVLRIFHRAEGYAWMKRLRLD